MHRNVFGRKAGSVPGYDYSAALKAWNIVWNETALDKWLTDPRRLTVGLEQDRTHPVDNA
jgi:cytochrome c